MGVDQISNPEGFDRQRFSRLCRNLSRPCEKSASSDVSLLKELDLVWGWVQDHQEDVRWVRHAACHLVKAVVKGNRLDAFEALFSPPSLLHISHPTYNLNHHREEEALQKLHRSYAFLVNRFLFHLDHHPWIEKWFEIQGVKDRETNFWLLNTLSWKDYPEENKQFLRLCRALERKPVKNAPTSPDHLTELAALWKWMFSKKEEGEGILSPSVEGAELMKALLKGEREDAFDVFFTPSSPLLFVQIQSEETHNSDDNSSMLKAKAWKKTWSNLKATMALVFNHENDRWFRRWLKKQSFIDKDQEFQAWLMMEMSGSDDYFPAFKTLVDMGWDYQSAMPGFGIPPLFKACSESCPKILRFLLERGLDPNAVFLWDMPAFSFRQPIIPLDRISIDWAGAPESQRRNTEECVRLLLEYGARMSVDAGDYGKIEVTSPRIKELAYLVALEKEEASLKGLINSAENISSDLSISKSPPTRRKLKRMS